MSNDTDSVKYEAQALLPWSDKEIVDAFCESGLKVEMKPEIMAAFKAGIRAREKPDSPKPFPASGAWFPTSVLGSPMREVKPGSWEVLTATKYTQSQFAEKIIKAYELGFSHFKTADVSNPFDADSFEAFAWDRGRKRSVNW